MTIATKTKPAGHVRTAEEIVLGGKRHPVLNAGPYADEAALNSQHQAKGPWVSITLGHDVVVFKEDGPPEVQVKALLPLIMPANEQVEVPA